MEKFYGNSIDQVKIPYLLEATPFKKIGKINFSKQLSEEVFFYNLYANTIHYSVESINQENTFFYNRIQNTLKCLDNKFEKVNLIHIAGYGGSGKTTFIRKLVWDEKKTRNIDDHIIDFEGEKKVFAFLLNRIINELYSDYEHNNFNSAKSIFNLKVFDLHRFENYISKIFSFFNDIIFRFDSSKGLSLCTFSIEATRMLNKYLERYSYSEKVKLLLVLYFLWLFNNKISESEASPLIIVFDNVDSINDTDEEQSLLIALKEFINDCNFFFGFNLESPNYYSKQKVSEIIEKTKLVCFITTRIVTIKKFLHLEPDLEKVYGWLSLEMPENYYDHRTIINNRINYYKKLESKDKSFNIQLLDAFQRFSNIVYKSDVFKRLYNGNYRFIIDALYSIVDNSNNKDLIYEAIQLEKNYSEFRMGAIGISISLLLDLFKKNGVYTEKLHLSECTLDYKISLSRIILTIIHEKRNTCSMLELFDCLYPLFSLDSICQVVYDLCEAKRGVWRRLIIFSKIFPQSSEDLVLQSKLYKKNIRDNERYSKIELCISGETYLDYVVPHFEFMLSRHRYTHSLSESKTYYPLFSNSSEDILQEADKRFFRFEKKIEWVYQDVFYCCKNSVAFSNQVMELLDLDRNEYIENTVYNYHSKSKDGIPKFKQSYESRLIFNHIGYLENYRRFLLKKYCVDLESRRIINEKVVYWIEKYLSLYCNEADCFHTVYQDKAANYLKKQVRIIKESNYNDYSTKIETDY